MKNLLIHFARTALLAACCWLASCASNTPRGSAPSNPAHRPASRNLSAERHFNVAKDGWEFEPGE